MIRLTRRAALKATGASIVLPTFGAASTAETASVETVVSIPEPEKVPENLAIDDDGFLYFGIARDPGQVWKLTPEQTRQTGLTLDDIEEVATLPQGRRVIGVEVVSDGTLYVAVSSDADDTGVWAIRQDGTDPKPFAPVSGFANDVLCDGERDRLLVSESMSGAVYEIPFDACDPASAASVWTGTDEDEPDGLLDTSSFGANGLTVGKDGAVYVAVTRAENDAGDLTLGRLVRVPVEDDGSAGEPEVYLESEEIFGADGITARGSNIYVAANGLNEVVRVTPSKQIIQIATGDDGLVFPSDVVFGTHPRQRDDLFICNFANDSPEDGAILRTTVS